MTLVVMVIDMDIMIMIINMGFFILCCLSDLLIYTYIISHLGHFYNANLPFVALFVNYKMHVTKIAKTQDN